MRRVIGEERGATCLVARLRLLRKRRQFCRGVGSAITPGGNWQQVPSWRSAIGTTTPPIFATKVSTLGAVQIVRTLLSCAKRSSAAMGTKRLNARVGN